MGIGGGVDQLERPRLDRPIEAWNRHAGIIDLADHFKKSGREHQVIAPDRDLDRGDRAHRRRQHRITKRVGEAFLINVDDTGNLSHVARHGDIRSAKGRVFHPLLGRRADLLRGDRTRVKAIGIGDLNIPDRKPITRCAVVGIFGDADRAGPGGGKRRVIGTDGDVQGDANAVFIEAGVVVAGPGPGIGVDKLIIDRCAASRLKLKGGSHKGNLPLGRSQQLKAGIASGGVVGGKDFFLKGVGRFLLAHGLLGCGGNPLLEILPRSGDRGPGDRFNNGG